MRLRVSIPLEFYSALVERCEIASPEYAFLKNGVINHDGATVIILSQADRANKLITWAQQFYPDAADRITIAIDAD